VQYNYLKVVLICKGNA